MLKENPIVEPVKDWATIRKDRVLTFLLWSYVALLAATVLILLLQGFKLWGFSLESSLLYWLGGATIGQGGGLLTIAITATFKDRTSSG
jgi:hypothetical protein